MSEQGSIIKVEVVLTTPTFNPEQKQLDIRVLSKHYYKICNLYYYRLSFIY